MATTVGVKGLTYRLLCPSYSDNLSDWDTSGTLGLFRAV